MLPAVLAVRFVLELMLLAAVGWWGARAVPGWPGVALGIVLVLLVAAVWGAVVSPRARVPVPGPARVALELLLFGGAGLALASTGHPWWGAGLVLADVAVVVTLGVLGRRSGPGPVSPHDVQRRLTEPR